MTTNSTAMRYHYKRYREHGYTALAAWTSARAHLFFMARMKEQIADHNRRSRAAKRGWKARRANAA